MRSTRIVTVTPNPAIDHVLVAEQFRIGAHQVARRIGRFPAGKGVNVSRVLAALGTRSVATGFVGRNELGLFERFLERAGRGRVVTQLLSVHGRTRDNITVTDPVLDTETHIRDQGFTVQRADACRLVRKAAMLAGPETVTVCSGSMPVGFTPGDLRTLVHVSTDAGARVVVDTSASGLTALRAEPIWLLKVNAEELSRFAGRPAGDRRETLDAARSVLRGQGGAVERVIVTRGPEGADLVSPNEEIHGGVFVHPGRIASTVGCGDALLAGVLHAYDRELPWAECLRWGVATATANAVTREPGSISVSDVEEFLAAAMMSRESPPVSASSL